MHAWVIKYHSFKTYYSENYDNPEVAIHVTASYDLSILIFASTNLI